MERDYILPIGQSAYETKTAQSETRYCGIRIHYFQLPIERIDEETRNEQPDPILHEKCKTSPHESTTQNLEITIRKKKNLQKSLVRNRGGPGKPT